MKTKHLLAAFLFITILAFTACTEDDGPCTETVCPDGLKSIPFEFVEGYKSEDVRRGDLLSK